MKNINLLILVVALLSIAALISLRAVNAQERATEIQKSAADIQEKVEQALRLRDKENNIAGAIKIMKEVLASNPENIGAMVFLAEFYKANGALEDGLKSVDKALSIEPKNVFALRVKGDILVQMGKYKEAEEVINSALSMSKPKTADYALCYYLLSMIYSKQGLKDKAKAYLEKAIENDPTNQVFKQQLKAMEALVAPK